ncbi:MAG: hypothetical protein IJM15_07475 [Erysipelotrichaceae bacterium]|nr:hypothetical protein [Erysipelotrichaceae bacterium]
MANKIFRSILLVAFIVVAATAIFVLDEMHQSFLVSQLDVLKAETYIIAYGIEKDGVSFLSGLNNAEYRLTLIDSDGTVLFDNFGNDVSEMDNHLDREEVIEAIQDGYGTSSRLSSTLMERLVYTAVKLNDGRIIRLSETVPSVFLVLADAAQPLLLVILIIILISFFIASSLTRRIVEPLNKLDMEKPDETGIYKEIKPIIRKITVQQEMINSDREILKQKKQEFETITANMNEGMVLLNAEMEIVDINKAAQEQFSIDESFVGKNISSTEEYAQFKELLDDAAMKQHGTKKVTFNGLIYELEVSPVELDGEILGFVLLIFDESYKEANEKMRKEFARNVSHELKTPLQAISGYAELLKNNLVDRKDLDDVYDHIYLETQRMIDLVSDVIRLSRLDDDSLAVTKEIIDLDELCRRNVEDCRRRINNNVTISYEGYENRVYGNRELIELIVHNLCDNAIKYNRENGSVTVKVYEEGENVILQVSDTGLGIPAADLERVFERFYRVDKGRSRQVGGTGLGLSIVKHACILNNAQIKAESVMGEGSTFTVSFNKV